jgi:hypothetical protein
MPDYVNKAVQSANNPFNVGGYDFSKYVPAIGGLLQSIFGNSGSPYEAFQKKMDEMIQKGAAPFKPFYDVGVGAMNPFVKRLEMMEDPTKFYSDISSKYQESPFAKFMTNQAMRGASNAASASGMLGSTAHQREAENYARDISSKDQQDFINKILGINQNYMGGLGSLMNFGYGSAGGISDLYKNAMQSQAQAAGNQRQGGINDILGGIGSILGFFG